MKIETAKKRKLIVGLVMSLIIVLFLGYEFLWNKNSNECTVNVAMQENAPITVTEEQPENIEVYIVGCVQNPGTYDVAKNTTIKKVAEMAGGFTPGADLEKINLVYKLKDNTMVVIKDKNEQPKFQESSGMKIIKGVSEEEQEELQVNINTASKDKLTELPGIGASVAKKIIKYREENGAFETIEDLMNIPGIGESKFNGIKDMVVIG